MQNKESNDRLIARTVDRYFRRLGPRAQVALCQLPLTVIIVGLVVAAPAAWPAVLTSELFVASLVLHALLFAGCLLVPWERLGPQAQLVIPILDLVAIGLSRNGAAPNLQGLSVLAIFPVIWLSASGMAAKTGIILSFFGPAVIGLPSLLAKIPHITPADITTAVLLPFMMLAVSLAVRFASVNMRLQQRRLESQEAEMRNLLAASKENERLLHTILDTVDVGIIAVDADGKVLLVNDQQNQFESAARPGDHTQSNDHPLQRDGDETKPLLLSKDRKTPLPPDKHPVERAIRGETFADHLVWFGEKPRQRAVSTAARAIRNDDGEFDGAVVVFNDVTGLVEAISAKDEFVANVSHEFRTPLNAVIGNLDLVLEDEDTLSPLAMERLEVAQRNAERLLALVSDLLVSASAAASIYPRKTDLAGLVESSIGSAHLHAERSRVELDTDVPAPLWVHVDPLRIGQALDNLVSNAIKYSPDGGHVKVSARSEKGWVKLQVQDAGMGMTEAETSRIFTRFYRSAAAKEASIPGVGLGLSITKAIVERHGGEISCTSKPGAGSTFTVALPMDGPPAQS
jgi:signal transduction histidine kinase